LKSEKTDFIDFWFLYLPINVVYLRYFLLQNLTAAADLPKVERDSYLSTGEGLKIRTSVNSIALHFSKANIIHQFLCGFCGIAYKKWLKRMLLKFRPSWAKDIDFLSFCYQNPAPLGLKILIFCLFVTKIPPLWG